MGKKILLLFGLCLLCGCTKSPQTERFDLTAQEQQKYTDVMQKLMEEYYWEYDRSSLTFVSAIVPEDLPENASLFLAADACEYNLRAKAGQEAVLAEAELLHYNGEYAGILQCWFQPNDLLGAAYRGGYDKEYYSLLERNPFLADGAFVAYEDWMGMKTTFMPGIGRFSPEGIYSQGKDAQGNTLVASIREGRVEVYRYLDGLALYRSLAYGTSLAATSVTFLGDGGLAVLISSIQEQGISDTEKMYSQAEKVILYDKNFNTTGEIQLEGELCTVIGAENNRLYLFIDQNVVFYQKNEETWERIGSRRLKHPVSQFHITDLDGNGEMEYLMTDGKDLYLYQNTGGSFYKIWSTHLGVENFYGPIASGDLNADGVKEIYACDTTATTIRYILTEKGLRTENEDIAYGQCMYPCDFDGNGIMDYWLVKDNIEREGELFLAQKGDKK